MYVVGCLLRMLHPLAEGSFFHLRDVIVYFVRRHTGPLFTALASEEGGQRLLSCLDYLHVPAVAEQLLALLDFHEMDERVREGFAASFPGEEFVTRLLARMDGDEDLADSANAAEFVQCLVAELHNNPRSFSYLVLVRDKAVLNKVLLTLCEMIGDHARGVRACHVDHVVAVLYAFASADNVADTAESGNPADYAVSDYVVSYIVHSPGFVSALFSMTASGQGQAPLKLAPHHISTLTLLYVCGQQNIKLVLDQATDAVWANLVRWFFRHSLNNVYHRVFFMIFMSAVLNDDRKALQAVIGGCQFLRVGIRHFAKGHRNAGFRGFLVGCFNVVAGKLEAKDLPCPNLKEAVDQHTPEFADFLPLLKQMNEIQVSPYNIEEIRARGVVSAPADAATID
jgi:hypothetical protein